MAARKEKDSLGEKWVPENAYYGIFTQRAIENFQISGIRTHPIFITSLGFIKKACALANHECGILVASHMRAISAATDEVIMGQHDEEFPIDVYQAGAGTPFNMNSNEVIANRATELLGGRKGEYLIHPNNHVNMSQSTNNVIPTAIRLTCAIMIDSLLNQLNGLSLRFRQKAEKYKDVVKVGRTHLQDAVPITYGQVFGSYATSCEQLSIRLQAERGELLAIGLGGTAVGTGLNAHPDFRNNAVNQLARITGLELFPAKDPVHHTWSFASFASLSSVLRIVAMEFQKIGNDLRLLSSGPNAGLNEISLPEVEPGSSIMPGKVNPSIIEALNMVCFSVTGNDHAIASACEAGQLELNVNGPVIGFLLFHSLEILTNALRIFGASAVSGISVNEDVCARQLAANTMTATALNPYIGYPLGAHIVQYAYTRKISLRQALLDQDVMPADCIDEILSPENMTKPTRIREDILKKIRKYPGYESLKRNVES